jgi:F-type H+-transporting ATPase subunit delta
MRDSGLSHRYAHALFGAALGGGVEVEVGNDLDELLGMGGADPSFRLFLEAPNVKETDKHQLLDRVFGPSAQPLTVRFLHLLLDKGRMLLFRPAAADYVDLLRLHMGRVKAKVTSAVPLSSEQITGIREALEAHTGKQADIKPVVDPAVLGGVMVQWGDQILDDTVRTRLHEIRDALLEVGIKEVRV